MRYIVTPTFSEKVIRSSSKILAEIGQAINLIEQSSKEWLLNNVEAILNDQISIYVLKMSECRILLSFGNDATGEYALLADLIVHGFGGSFNPPILKNPRTNPMIDPNRNMTIDPNRNMTIDPNRNMTIDPNRNMIIDPRRNMTIDPNRNMTIDPNRNMTIDPRRNMTIDPNRNWIINPKQNAAWDGPYLYSRNYNIEGFIVRANDKVSLLFEPNGNWAASIIEAGKNYNIFTPSNKWMGFLVPNGAQGFNKFSFNNQWDGFIVGKI
jgi:hypothetical protein